MRARRIRLDDNLKSLFGDYFILNIFDDDKESIEKIRAKDGSEGLWYQEYKKAFPITNERETPEGFIHILKEGKKHPKSRDYIMMSLEAKIKGENKIIGGSTVNRLTSNDYTVAIFEYTFVDKNYREKGIGGILTKVKLEEVKRQADSLNSKFVATLSETKNLEKASKNDIKKEDMNIAIRRKILGKWGYKIIDFPYVHLPLYKGFKHIYSLDLLIRPTDEKKDEWKDYIPSKDLKKILYMYFKTFYKNFESDHWYKKMMKHISQKEKIPLKHLE